MPPDLMLVGPSDPISLPPSRLLFPRPVHCSLSFTTARRFVGASCLFSKSREATLLECTRNNQGSEGAFPFRPEWAKRTRNDTLPSPIPGIENRIWAWRRTVSHIRHTGYDWLHSGYHRVPAIATLREPKPGRVSIPLIDFDSLGKMTVPIVIPVHVHADHIVMDLLVLHQQV